MPGTEEVAVFKSTTAPPEPSDAPIRLIPASPPGWDHGRMDEQVIPILRVANAADAVAWYERLGFT